MRTGAVLGLFACNVLWRLLHLRTAGRVLLRALGSPDENTRTVAGMFLVQSGRRAEPLLEEALTKRENLPMVLRVLASVYEIARSTRAVI